MQKTQSKNIMVWIFHVLKKNTASTIFFCYAKINIFERQKREEREGGGEREREREKERERQKDKERQRENL